MSTNDRSHYFIRSDRPQRHYNTVTGRRNRNRDSYRHQHVSVSNLQTRQAVTTRTLMNKRLRLAVMVTIALLAVVCNSCGREVPTDSFVRDEMNSVRERTVPSDAVVDSSSDPKLNEYSIIANWEFETSEEKSVYMAWVSQQFQRDFTLKTSSETSAVFLKDFRGDVESVTIQTSSSNGRLHVRVTNSIYPD